MNVDVIGSSIGSYRILGKLGEGGMGAVYAAEHALLRRRAAIKVLLPELSVRPEVVERFFNEARASTAIGDVGVVQIFDFGYHTDGSAFIVMELLEGESLEARLRRVGALSVREAMRITRQLAQTLGTVHARGVIHRDLKPDNVFVVPDAEAEGGERTKILDFGIAKLTDGDGISVSRTRTGAVIGTPLYMSPEQCRGHGVIDHRSDIYSLGCVVFYLLCGRPPFDARGSGELLVAHMTIPAPAPSSVRPGIPMVVDTLVLRCLEKDPARRFESMAALAQAVAAVQAQLTGGAVGLPDTPTVALHLPYATPPPPTPPPTPTTLGSATGVVATATTAAPRSRTPWLVAGLVALSAAAGIAFAILQRGGSGTSDRGTAAAAEGAASADAGAPVLTPDAGARAQVTPDAAAPIPVAADAGAAVAEVTPDAGAAKAPEPKKKRPKKKKKEVVEDPYALPTP